MLYALIIRRLVLMVLTMVVMSFLVFTALEVNPDGVARKAIGQFTTYAQRIVWLIGERYYVGAEEDERAAYEADGYVLLPTGADPEKSAPFLVAHPAPDGAPYLDLPITEQADETLVLVQPKRVPLVVRYARWLGRFVSGDFGLSYRFKRPVNEIIWGRLGNTAILAGLVMLIMIPLSLFLGVMAGIREGSLQDRGFSFVAILTTSVPEFASAVFFVWLFTFYLGWLPGTSLMTDGFSFTELILPITVLVVYGCGYIARITRASMAEVMRSAFIRTAVLKGLPYRDVIMKHALRNALITPVTVIMLQFPWLLSGVIVVEYAFAYKGFGSLLWEAADFNDPFLIEACAMISVVVVVVTQLIADIIYTQINPRIRFQ